MENDRATRRVLGWKQNAWISPSQSSKVCRNAQKRISKVMRTSAICFLKTMLDGMASAQDQTQSQEANDILKPFIASVSLYVVSNAKAELESIEKTERLEHAIKNIQLQAMAHNQFACGDHPRVTEIERIATEALKGTLSP